MQVNPPRGGPSAGVEVLRRVLQSRVDLTGGYMTTTTTGVRQINTDSGRLILSPMSATG